MSDRSTLRGELKSIAKPIVEQYYNLQADASIPNQLQAQRAVQQSAANHLKGGSYLRGPKDDAVRNNHSSEIYHADSCYVVF
jgi:hypothetical protein